MGLREFLGLSEASSEATTLREVNGQLEASLELLEERLAELEFAADDEGWERLSSGDTSLEFSRAFLDRLIRRSRLSYLANPLTNRSVEIQRLYVFAQGLSIAAADEAVNEVVQAFLRLNKREFRQQALGAKEVELAATGNLFFRLFPNISSGEVRVRTLPVEEIRDIVRNPEDRSEPWFYLRRFTQGDDTREVLYPDWDFEGVAAGVRRPPTFEVDGRRYDVDWDTPIYHVRVGGFAHMRFGVPETYAALDWAKAYQGFVQDWFTIVKSYARFAWRHTAKSGTRGMAAARTKLATGIGSTGQETNPPPLPGALVSLAEGQGLEPIRTAGATTKAEDGRRGLLMVAAAMGLPETMFGDVSVGTLATATSLDRPTELKFRDRQTLFGEVLEDLVQYAIDWAMKAPSGALPATLDYGRRHIDVGWPPLLERSVKDQVASVVSAATLDGREDAQLLDRRNLRRMLLTALGEDDIDQLLDQLDEFDQDLADEIAVRQAADPETAPTREAFVAAVGDLREAIRGLRADPV